MSKRNKKTKTNAHNKIAKARKRPAPSLAASRNKRPAKKTAFIKKTAKSLKTQQKQPARAKEEIGKKRPNLSIMPPDVVKKEIDKLLASERATDYLRKNVSRTAVDVICMLASPRTDEYLAEQLGMKINAVRRILNIMQGYGITNYYVSKNTKGWLSFAWYINTSKLDPFLEHINNMERESVTITDNCNDYFMCGNCYKTDGLIYTFDAAFESSFKCQCGKNLARMDRPEAEAFAKTTS
jgi:transcription initiation factor IIE alpha subunit